MNKREKLISLIPALWAGLFDTIITIDGQSEKYWNGNLNMANEGNPIGNFLMKNHVSGIFVVCGAWLALVGVLGYYLPKKTSRVFLLFVLMAHSWGASSWISKKSYWLVILFILFNSILFYIVDDKINKKKMSGI